MQPIANRITGEGEESPDDLLANPLNHRVHPEEQQKALEGALREVGWVQRVIVNTTTGHVVDGHARVALAQRRGEPTVPVVYVELSEHEERVILAALDAVTNLAGVDDDMLAQILDGLEVEDADLAAFLDSLLDGGEEEAEEGETDEDDVPEAMDDATSQAGDVWVMGPHRLICGDATNIGDVEAVTRGYPVDMVWTDPPYNVDYSSKNEALNAADKGNRVQRAIAHDKMGDPEFLRFLTDAMTSAWAVTKEGGAVYVAHADSQGLPFRTAMVQAGWDIKQCLVWVKNNIVLGRQDYQWQHEPILYGWKPGAAHTWLGEFDKRTVVDDEPDPKSMTKAEMLAEIKRLRLALNTSAPRVDKPHASEDHPTMKPVELVAHMIRNSAREGEAVLDLFAGSGTTLIACVQYRREARLVEQDPHYCDVIVRRWMKYTGEEAVLEATGETFSDVMERREAGAVDTPGVDSGEEDAA